MTIVSEKSSYIIFSLVCWMHYKEMSITYVYVPRDFAICHKKFFELSLTSF